MKFWVGVTDNQWFKYLSDLRPDEVNFWQPSATPPFTGAPVGLPFLFKLRRPNNHIAGGGFFVTYSRLPLSLARLTGDEQKAVKTTMANINIHLKNVYEEGELSESATIKDYLIVRQEGPRQVQWDVTEIECRKLEGIT